jgi:predicted nuclease of predicted toxin-antitoxin system
VTTRFLIDAQLPPGLARRLISRGYAAQHVNLVGLGAAGDDAIWQHAVQTDATLVTKDEDFAALAARDASGPQVIWIRIGNISNDALWQAVEAQLVDIVQALDAGERVIEVL